MQDLSDADFVVEAIPEIETLKRSVFERLDKVCVTQSHIGITCAASPVPQPSVVPCLL